MNAEGFDVTALERMMHSPVRNYALPGLTSWLIGQPGPAGTMRVFTADREHQECITPHSHRFDFQCWVLKGSVRNRIWRKTYDYDKDGDDFQVTKLVYRGDFGAFEKHEGSVHRWLYTDYTHEAGQCYRMKAAEVHSIYFSRGAMVMFFEGPTVSDSSVIIEPYTNHKAIPTFKVEPWMFERESHPAPALGGGDGAN